jgi:hypothetical protein
MSLVSRDECAANAARLRSGDRAPEGPLDVDGGEDGMVSSEICSIVETIRLITCVLVRHVYTLVLVKVLEGQNCNSCVMCAKLAHRRNPNGTRARAGLFYDCGAMLSTS